MAKKRIKIDVEYEARLAFAINALKNKNVAKLCNAARVYNVSESAIRGRLRRKLTPTEEDSLRSWIFSMERRGYSLQPSMITSMANILLAERDEFNPPKKVGVNWIRSYMKRQPDLKRRLARRSTYSRAKCEDSVLIRRFFEQLYALKTEYDIADEDIYNFDETGFSLGAISTAKVVSSSDRTGKPSVAQPPNREWVAVVECIGGNGIAVPPLIVFEGDAHLVSWYTQPGLPSDWSIVHSPNGWMSNGIALEWLEKIFEPHTRPLTQKTYRLLILDGHSGHLTPAFDQACKRHNIVAFCMPPNSSHLLHPLHAGVFSVLKSSYRSAVESRLRNGYCHIDKEDFLQILPGVHSRAYTRENICEGFSRTGIIPLSPEKVLSQLQTGVSKATPVTTSPGSSSRTWSTQMPDNARTRELQVQSIQKMHNVAPLSRMSRSTQAFSQLAKGCTIMMRNASILAREIRSLRAMVDDLQQNGRRHTRAVQQKGILRGFEPQE